jgi:hypothetical protein
VKFSVLFISLILHLVNFNSAEEISRSISDPIESLKVEAVKIETLPSKSLQGKYLDCHHNLLFGASINPKRKNALEEVAQAKQDGAVLIKWIPSIMDFDPADTAFIPFYLAMKRARLPLLTHTGTENSLGADLLKRRFIKDL